MFLCISRAWSSFEVALHNIGCMISSTDKIRRRAQIVWFLNLFAIIMSKSKRCKSFFMQHKEHNSVVTAMLVVIVKARMIEKAVLRC